MMANQDVTASTPPFDPAFHSVCNGEAAAPLPGTCTSEENSDGPDFAYLPETAWVRVLEYLPLVDQYHVSVTCSRLYRLFGHPTLWRSAHLNLIGAEHNFCVTHAFMPKQFQRIVEQFGHLFQRLTIVLSGHLVQLEDETRKILANMAKVCRLEHLVLQVGIVTSNFHQRGFRPRHDDLLSIVQLVTNAFRLKRLEIMSWPMYPEIFSSDDINVFEVMKKNPKLATLETMRMFWLKNRQWSELSPLLPSPAYTTSLISHFQALKHVALRSPMLSNELLLELASSSRTKLLSLQILVIYNTHDHTFHIPTLSPSSWSSLKASSPNLQVECAIMSRVPDIELAGLLLPEIPLVAIRILKYARCSPQMMISLMEKYHGSLQSFICYNDPTDCGPQLLNMIKACKKINTVIFHGQIHSQTVTDIAQEQEHWQEFEFIENCINTERKMEEFDEDTVIGQNAGGDLVQVRLMRFHSYETEEERHRALEDMYSEVSKRVGYSWRPFVGKT